MTLTWLAALMGAVLAAMVLAHLARPRIERRRISSRRFFRELPPISRSARRWRWNPPPMTLSFWLRVAVVALLLAALLSVGLEWEAGAVQVSGAALLLDTSASLSTGVPQGGIRFEVALQRLQELLQQVRPSGQASCFRLLAFDLEVREIASGSASQVLTAAQSLSPRALGTNLDLVRQSARRLLEGEVAGRQAPSVQPTCPVGAVVAISDRPAPQWAAELSAWIDIGGPVDNAGFTTLSARRDPLTGRVDEVLAELRSWGPPPARARLRVQAPDGSILSDQSPAWERGRASLRFAPARAGRHRLVLTSPDAYDYDNQAVIDIPPARRLRVEWGIQAPALLQRLGWQRAAPTVNGAGQGPDLKVLPWTELADASPASQNAVPALYLGPGYAQPSGGEVPPSTQISDFLESSPLLAGLNFDVAEALGIAAPPQPLPETFTPVLRGLNGIWIGLRADPPAVYIPGPPLGGEDDAGRFSTTVFFNAVRHLLGHRPLPPLYTLTTPSQPLPEGSRLALHDQEGNTAYQPRSLGNLSTLSPVASRAASAPVWPALLVFSAALFLAETLLSARKP
ncbi:MAG TPA: hypothetical protein VLU25_05175 [Acidobacteriota bacterium]|nr:hypothetical protein [Acidobacteriota bacterium]